MQTPEEQWSEVNASHVILTGACSKALKRVIRHQVYEIIFIVYKEHFGYMNEQVVVGKERLQRVQLEGYCGCSG